MAQVDFVVRSRMSDGSLRRITVWDAAGKVVYADRAELRGRRFPLPDEAAARFGRAHADRLCGGRRGRPG